MILKAVITTFDNLPLLQRQLSILRADPLVDEIIVVDNGCEDGTGEWLSTEENGDLYVIHRENQGAGAGRNTGLDAASRFDFVLMLDGGILPLRGGTQQMLAYLQRRPDAQVIGVDHSDTVTEEAKASADWAEPILDVDTYWNRCLSQTHYCLARYAAFDGLRFSEEGPFGEPGWGADDNEMACQWLEAGIVVHVVKEKLHPYRRGSGSFERLYRETGIWPNAYGSVYEQRVVWTQQNWPQYLQGIQWGEPWLTVLIVDDGDVERTIQLIKQAHDKLRLRHFGGRWTAIPNPYSIVVCSKPGSPFLSWAEPRRLRQHHGDTIVVDGQIVRRSPANEALWTGDFRIWAPAAPSFDLVQGVRHNAHYFALVRNQDELQACLDRYNELHPDRETAPTALREEVALELVAS